MDPRRVDSISRFFAERRISRRNAVRGAGALAAVSTVAGLSQTANAQEATPIVGDEAGNDADKVSFLFVQTFGAGSIADTGNGHLTLTADHLTGQTVYFSDRPERIVGTVNTEKFLGTARNASDSSAATPDAGATPEGGIGFTPFNPPNAALVFNSADGSDDPGDVLVVELINPTYDPASGHATYEINVLADDAEVEMTLESEPVASADAIRDFEGASLFIDDCPDFIYSCYGYNIGNGNTDIYLGDIHYGFCYDWKHVCCNPCAPIPDNGDLECLRVYGYDACHGGSNGSYGCASSAQEPSFECGAGIG